jgi:chemotaxis protein CheY-P-specific phosphatase CheC
MQETMMMTMKQAISNVLETMFFLPIQIVEDRGLLNTWFTEEPVIKRARVQFAGPFSGSFFLLVPANMAREVAANFLGLEEAEVERDQEEDTVKEALNMIGGYVLSQVDKADEFQLGIPEILPENEFDTALTDKLHENMIFIKTEENHLAAGFRLG